MAPVSDCYVILSLMYSLIQKNGYTFAIVYCSKCLTVFLNQMLVSFFGKILIWTISIKTLFPIAPEISIANKNMYVSRLCQ